MARRAAAAVAVAEVGSEGGASAGKGASRRRRIGENAAAAPWAVRSLCRSGRQGGPVVLHILIAYFMSQASWEA